MVLLLSNCFTSQDSELSQIWAYNCSWLVDDHVKILGDTY